MKILIATGLFPPDIGGPATYSKLLSDEFPKNNIAVDVRSFGSVRSLPKVIRHFVYGCSLIWHARKADVIFAQDTVSVGLPALLAAYLLGKHFVVRVPGDYAWEQSVQRFGVKDSIDDFQNKRYGIRVAILRWIQNLVVRQADKIIAPSAYLSRIVDGWAKGKDITMVYNGIDIKSVRALSKAKNQQSKTLVSAGRLVPWKGFEMLINAMKRLQEWNLEIVGDGPDKERLTNLIRSENLSDRVVLCGRLDKTSLLRKISEAGIFALNTAYEGLSHQIIEVMALGVPVITTSVGGNPELIENDKTGILINVDDEKAFIEGVQKISSEQTFREEIIKASLDKSERFSIQNTVRLTKAVFDSLGDAYSLAFKRRQTAAKLLRYLFSGGIAAVTDLVLLYVFTDVWGMWYIISSILAFLVAFVVSFILQKFFTFQDHAMEGVHGQALIYLAVTGTNLALNTGLIYLFVQYTGLHYIPAQIVTSILIAIESFLVYQAFIFKK